MSRFEGVNLATHYGVPRASGDEPEIAHHEPRPLLCSPRERG